MDSGADMGAIGSDITMPSVGAGVPLNHFR